MDNNKKQPAVRDVGKITKYLTNMFNSILTGLPRAVRNKDGSNMAYKYETEFAYRLNEIMIGPPSLQQKYISSCNEYIDEVMQDINKLKQK